MSVAGGNVMEREHDLRLNKKLQKLRMAYENDKATILRVMLVILLMIMIAAQIFPPVAEFIAQKKFLTFAVVVGVVLALFDVVLSHDRAHQKTDDSIVLSHFSLLRDYLQKAFESEMVEVNIAAYSGETFYNVLSEFLQDVADGRRRVSKLDVKILVPDCSAPMAVPCLVGGLTEDADYKASIELRNRRFAGEFRNYFNEIRQRTRAIDASLEIRTHKLAPLFKLIIINQTRGFVAFYPISDTSVEFSGRVLHLWDYRGERARFIGFSADGRELERELLTSLNEWFKAVWDNLATKLA